MLDLTGTNSHASVSLGAQFLDEKIPGWADRIDLDTLDLLHTSNCVLGQLYPAGEIPLWARHGFDSAEQLLAHAADRHTMDDANVPSMARPYRVAVYELGLNCDQQVLYGFRAPRPRDVLDVLATGRDYDQLTNEWREAIKARRGALVTV